MEAKTIVITGGSDGIGAAAARELKDRGHTVVLVGRNPEKTEKLAKELNCPYHTVDYSRLSDVVRLARELADYPRIDVLCNNAGGALNERTVTEDGIEKTFQINVLGAFLLTNLLMDNLIQSGATVIQTSSSAANLFGQKLDLTDLQNKRAYATVKAYGEAKLCNILFTRELQKRYGAQGLHAVAFEPGIVRSNFASESTWYFKVAYHTPLKYLFTISSKRSARRQVRLAVGEPDKDFLCGAGYSYKRRFKIKFRDDVSGAASLWEQSEEMTKKYM